MAIPILQRNKDSERLRNLLRAHSFRVTELVSIVARAWEHLGQLRTLANLRGRMEKASLLPSHREKE